MDRTGHDNAETAVTSNGNATMEPAAAELEKQVSDLAASPHFVPLMGSFRDLLEAERRRNRLRTLILGAGTILVLALFIWGPLHIMQTYIEQSERRMAAERQSLERVERALNESINVLSEASRDLRTTLEMCRQIPPPAATPATLPTVDSARITASPSMPVAPPPAAGPEGATPSLPVPGKSTVEPPAAASSKGVASPAAAPATNAPARVEATAPDLFRALSSSPAVPPPPPDKTNRVAAPPPAAVGTRLTDTLADVERTIQSIRLKRAALTNATGVARP